jgi:hypothetical protein
MKYSDGQEARLGDKVKLWEGCYGVVVCSMDTNEYPVEYPKDEWGYLKTGVLIDSDKAGLIHYIKPEQNMELIERAKETMKRA